MSEIHYPDDRGSPGAAEEEGQAAVVEVAVVVVV